ncbi:MAG TPA: methyltransferase domain-containing protein [Candidatus Angelobacter sp.]|nr:methyltransferase domain-containing protein [Candidatus Angelobacter sp.]
MNPAGRATAALSGSANHSYYNSSETAEYFGTFKKDLFKAEAVILDTLREEIKDQPILEIGIGGGRITQHLRPLSADYIGVDYSEKMIEFCRHRFPDLPLFVCDARDMSRFEAERFGTVMFGYNGIDEVGARDRVLILQEIHRVLKQNGVFIFSSHNLDWESVPACFREGLSFRGGVLKSAKGNIARLRVYASGLANWYRARISRQGHAIFLEYEASPGISLPAHYISQQAQFFQLQSAGFRDIQAISADGEPLNDQNRRKHFMIFYVARK